MSHYGSYHIFVQLIRFLGNQNLQNVHMCIVPADRCMICPSFNCTPSGKWFLKLTARLVVLRNIFIILQFFCYKMSAMLKHLPFIHHACLYQRVSHRPTDNCLLSLTASALLWTLQHPHKDLFVCMVQSQAHIILAQTL